MPPYRVLILSDGRPGHFNLSEGVAAAVERIRPAATTRREVRRGRWPGAALAALASGRFPAGAMLKAVYGIAPDDLPACDLIVSAGAETLAANVWLARARSVPNVFYGSLRLFRPTDFSLVLTSYARNARRPRHALALKPSRIDPDSFGAAPHLAQQTPLTLGLLIGGDAGPIRYAPDDWQRLLDLLAAPSPASLPIRWLVANSRRTPDWISDEIARRTTRAAAPIGAFLDVRSAGPGTLPQILTASAAMLCTADSSSMLSECIWARRPTLALAPGSCSLTPDEADYRAWLQDSGWTATVPLAGLTPARAIAALGGLQPTSGNPQLELAQLLRDRLGIA